MIMPRVDGLASAYRGSRGWLDAFLLMRITLFRYISREEDIFMRESAKRRLRRRGVVFMVILKGFASTYIINAVTPPKIPRLYRQEDDELDERAPRSPSEKHRCFILKLIFTPMCLVDTASYARDYDIAAMLMTILIMVNFTIIYAHATGDCFRACWL